MENLNDNKILDVRNLRISFRTNGGTVKAVRGINFSLYRGRTLAIVGESGSGKSVTSKAILGILANNKIIENGQIIYDGQDLLKIDEEHFHKIRGVKISMIFQDPLSSLNPIMIVGKQLTEAMVLKHKADIKEAKKDLKKIMGALSKANPEKAKELAALLGHAKKDGFKPESLEAYRNLFFEGSKYSVATRLEAINVLLPELEAAKNANFADEKEFAALIKHLLSLKKTLKECILAISTEADNDVEVFPSVLKYIQASIKEAAKNEKKRDAAMAKYGVTDGDFYALPPAVRATLPEVILTRDEYISELKEAIDVLINHLNDIKNQGDEEISKIADKALKSCAEAMEKSLSVLTKKEADERAINMLKEVGIHDAERRFKQYPFELSGGMRQRIVIAIALCSSPEVLICDEPTTALDVTIQSQILELINKLKKERNLSIVFITHDLGVVANMADDIAVMYAGKIVEYGTSTDIFYDPRHPYTIALLGSMPDLETKEKLQAIPGTPPNMLLPPKGDAFADRNAHALAIDYLEQPPFFQVSDTHFAATWVLDELAPDFDISEVVKARIRRALSAHPEYTPKPTNTKNSVLKILDKKGVTAEIKVEAKAKAKAKVEAKKEEAPKEAAPKKAPAEKAPAKKAAPKKTATKKEAK